MVNYYEILKVSQSASSSEIKSAYRRLARELHPDVTSTGDSSREFSIVAEAYKVLSNRKTRQMFDSSYFAVINSDDSVLSSENYHAQRLREIALDKKFNAIVDEIINKDRKNTRELQQFIFPLVALFVSTIFVTTFRPLIWSNSEVIGKIILLTLFAVGTLHLFRRLIRGFQQFSKDDVENSSLLDGQKDEHKPFSAVKSTFYIFFGLLGSVLIGYFLGNYLTMFVTSIMPRMFSPSLHFDLLFYPPIVVLIADLAHNITSRFDL
jgi:curved DNA-binding protein CbpA